MILRLGSKGEEVAELQRYLKITDDGDFGPNTEAAVKKWQEENGLKADGIVGPKTISAMERATTDMSEMPLDISTVLKLGSTGDDVMELQSFLRITVDGDFGPGTEAAVKEWQRAHGLTPDGVVGPLTLARMSGSITDNEESDTLNHSDDLVIHPHYLSLGEYQSNRTIKEYLFLHHTAGWDNPFRTIDIWDNDKQGAIATEFVVGGQSVKGDRDKYDGDVVQAFPDGYWGWHLGTGASYMHSHSIGIEVCNFGQLDSNGQTWAKVTAAESQKVTLSKAFRGYKDWHRYSDKQLESLRKLILFIAERDSIDVRAGLVERIRDRGADAFEFDQDVRAGKLKGMWTHTNVRTDKFDMFPQQELMDMLLSL